MEIQLESSLPLVPAARLILSITKYRDWKLNFLQLDEIWRGEAGYSRLDKSFASTAYDIFFVFFSPPPLEALARIRGRRSSTTRRASLFLFLSLSLDFEQHPSARKSGCSCLRIWKIFFARSIRLRVEGHPARRIRDNKDTSNTWRWLTSIWKKSGERMKGSWKINQRNSSCQKESEGGSIELFSLSLSLSRLDDGMFHEVITIACGVVIGHGRYHEKNDIEKKLSVRRIVATKRLWFKKRGDRGEGRSRLITGRLITRNLLAGDGSN